MKTALIVLLCRLYFVTKWEHAEHSRDRVKSGREPSEPEQVIAPNHRCWSVLKGHDQKVIGWLGDAAVIVTRHLSERHLSKTDIEMTLVVLIGAFADPSFVRNDADSSTKDNVARLAVPWTFYRRLQKLKTRITDARKYIEDRCVQCVQGRRDNLASDRFVARFCPHRSGSCWNIPIALKIRPQR